MDILERHSMADCRSVSTPMVPNLSLMKLSAPEMDVTTYQSAVGSLMYMSGFFQSFPFWFPLLFFYPCLRSRLLIKRP